MRVVVDSNIWSLAFRRRRSNLSPVEANRVAQLERLLRADEAVLIGPIRQEVLTGVRSEAQFEALKETLASWPDTAIESADYVRAASFGNLLRSKGVAGSAVDLIVCAVAYRLGAGVFSADQDIDRFAEVLPVEPYR